MALDDENAITGIKARDKKNAKQAGQTGKKVGVQGAAPGGGCAKYFIVCCKVY
jgi:hypothetical protein